MTILQTRFLPYREFLLKSVLPLTLAFAGTVSYPAKIKTHQVRLISKALIIQTSKMDPPRIAFDEVNQIKKTRISSDWNSIQSKKGTALLSGAANLWKTPAKDIFRVRRVNIPEMVFTENDVSKYVQEQRWYANLSPVESERISMANEKFNTLEEDWTPPTLEQATQKSIAEVAQKDPQVERQINNHKNPSVMKGQVELQGGLPSGPDWIIEVARYQDNIKKEDGRVDNKKSTFEIQVEDFSGSLQAKLKDVKTGQVIGQGSIRLTAQNVQPNSGTKIIVQKSNDDVATNYGSFYKNTKNLRGGGNDHVATDILFASINQAGKTDASGVYRFDQIRNGSRGIVRTQAENFYPGMDMVKAGENRSYPLFPEKMIKALRDIIRDQAVSSEYAETGSVVWGQVLENGKPVSGAEINVESLPDYKAVYLNSLLIPDPKQKGTSENGYFVILDLPAGFQSILATRGETYLSHVNTVVDDETLSTAEIVINDVKNPTDLKVFDAFSGSPQQASVEIQSLPEAIDVLGYAEVNLPAVDRLSFMNITPNNPGYLKTMMSYEDNQDFIHVPLISADWIHGMMVQQKINLFSDRGMIVGFVDSENYEVYLGYDAQFPRENIVYFTAQGSVSQKAVAGGGFIIFNVPMGPQAVVISEGETDMIQTQLVDVNSEATSVIKL